MGDLDLLDPPAAKRAESLDYKPDPVVAGRVSVRGFRLLLALTLLNTTLLGVSVTGPQLFPFLRGQWTQWRANRAQRQAEAAAKVAAAAKQQKILALEQQCLTFSRPAGTVVYEENPAEAARRLREGESGYTRAMATENQAPAGWIPPMRAVTPDVFRDYLRARYGSPAVGPRGAVLFLHERKTPGGVPHLVYVDFDAGAQFFSRYDHDERSRRSVPVHVQSKSRRVSARAVPLAAAGEPRQRLPERTLSLVLPDSSGLVAAPARQDSTAPAPPVDYGNVLRVFAGQPDPADPTHFTIPYELDGRGGVIDGWLKDDRIELRPREGRWVYDNGETWTLTPPPATRPALYPPPEGGAAPASPGAGAADQRAAGDRVAIAPGAGSAATRFSRRRNVSLRPEIPRSASLPRDEGLRRTGR